MASIFDGTLAEVPDGGLYSPLVIGPPVPAMVGRIKMWLARGIDVRVFTARVCGMGSDGWDDVPAITAAIQAWCVEHIGVALPVTNVKDYHLWQLWDDRAVRVVENTGEPCCDHAEREVTFAKIVLDILDEEATRRQAVDRAIRDSDV